MKHLLFVMAMFAFSGACASGAHFCKADSDKVRFTGRAARNVDGSLSFDWSGSHFTFCFDGSACSMRVSDTGRNYYNVFVDGELYGKATTEGPVSSVVLAEGLAPGRHTVIVQKRTEAEQGRTTLFGIETDGVMLPLPAAPARLIEFIGDSHTCGYGTEGKSAAEPFTPETENCDLAWGCIIARYFDAEYVLVAHSGQGVVRNWADEKETSDLSMRQRVLRTFDMDEEPQWNFRDYTPDIVVIKLGTNDCSTGITPSKEAFGAAFAEMYGNLRGKYGAVPILYVVPTGAEPFYGYLRTIMAGLDDRNLHCIMHFDGVTDNGADMGAGYHLSHRGQRKMAAAVVPYIATITGWDIPMRAIR